MNMPIKTPRGVYYDLDKSPYTSRGVCGDIYKFRSKKRLEIFERELPKRINQCQKAVDTMQKLIGSKYNKPLPPHTKKWVEEQLYKEVMEGKNKHSDY